MSKWVAIATVVMAAALVAIAGVAVVGLAQGDDFEKRAAPTAGISQQASPSGLHTLLVSGDAVLIREEPGAFVIGPGEISLGVGIGGRLGLVGGRCVGFLPVGGVPAPGRVIVWPPGTTISGAGADLEVTSEGKTVRIGDNISAGNELGHKFAGIRAMLPEACRPAKFVQVGLTS